MRRYILRTRYLTALPYTRRPTAPELIEAARRLRRLDDSGAPKRDIDRIRAHAVHFAIPRWWRDRCKPASPPWPPHSSIETWIALGASRALDRKPPEACTPAYTAGYMPVHTAYKLG